MTNAIPIGRKTPILPLTILIIMKINPLIEKSIAAVLYDFEFLDGLPFTMKVNIFYLEVTLSLLHVSLVVNNQNEKGEHHCSPYLVLKSHPLPLYEHRDVCVSIVTFDIASNYHLTNIGIYVFLYLQLSLWKKSLIILPRR